MVTQVFKAVYKEIRGLHEAAYVLAGFTFASQILALVRDRMLAHHFGAGRELDIYYTAFRIPDLLFVVFASVLSVYVLIPFVSEAKLKGGEAAARAMLSQVFTLFLVFYGVIAFVIGFFAHSIVGWFFPGFTQSEYAMLALLLQVLLLQPFLLSISNLFGVITQLENRFIMYALSPVLYNVGIVAGIIFFYPTFGIIGLIMGVVLGALFHLLVQIPLLATSRSMPRLTGTFDRELLRRILTTSAPRALTLSLHQFVLLAMVGIASAMAAGSISVFQFALNLQSVPLAIIGVSYSVAAFPTLARMFTNGDRDAFVAHVATALRHIFFWSIPLIALIVVTRAQIVRALLGSGSFDWDDTRLTAAALALFSLSLAAQAVNLLIVRAFYAGGDTRTPFYVTLLSSVVALALGIGFYLAFTLSGALQTILGNLLRVSDVPGSEVLMLPLGYSIAMVLHSVLLLSLFMRRFGLRAITFGGVLARASIASVTGGVMAYAILNTLVFGIQNDTVIGILLQGGIAGIAGMGTVILTLYFVGSPELHEVGRALHRRMLARPIVTPQQSDDVAA